MAYNTDDMVREIAKKPGIRTVEIADLVDCDVDMVMPALQDLISKSWVICKEIIGPNGLKTNSFQMHDSYVRTEVPTAPAKREMPDELLHGLNKAIPAVKAAPAVEQDTKPKVDPIQPAPRAPIGTYAAGMTNVEKAIQFINANGGTATSAELHRELGLKPEDSPSTYLKGGVDAAKLKKDGKTWTLGPGRQPAAETPTSTTPIAPAADKAPAVQAVKVPKFSDQRVEPPEPSDVPLVEIPNFACALWSDGDLMLVRGDDQFVLTPAEVNHVQAYLNRFRPGGIGV